MDYQIVALKYGSNVRRSRLENVIYVSPDDCHDSPMPMDFFVWAVIGEDRTILVDTGSAAHTMAARGHDHLVAPVDALADVGVDLSRVTDVVTTHLHWDHAGNIDELPDARLHVQRAELAHATGPSMCSQFLRRPYDLEQVSQWLRALYDGRVAFHEGDEEIVPGISLHHVGGHTPGMQVVRVRTERGNVVLASDSVHYYENLESENPFPVLVSTIDYVGALRTVSRLADGPDHIIPGHDPRVLQRFPAAVAGATGSAALHLEPQLVPS